MTEEPFEDTRRKSIVYVTPVMPQRSGNGLAMRAGQILEALSRHYDVHLFVVPVAGDLGPPPEFVCRETVRIGGLDLATSLDPYFALIARVIDPEDRRQAEIAYPKPRLSRFFTGESAVRLFDWANQVPMAAIHVMRLYLAPLAQTFLSQPAPNRPFCVLDLDDDEAQARLRLARLHSERGNRHAAAAETAEAAKYGDFAARFLPAFDRVLVCSNADARRLGRQFPRANFVVVPNSSTRLSSMSGHRPSSDGPLRLLFVGTLGYFANVDAALFLCREVLPALRRLTSRRIHVDIVGGGVTTALGGLELDRDITQHGFVADLAPLYAAADVAVAPLRAGGGTRIKILEAFGYSVPVVATGLGAEGIDAFDGVHLLLADDAETFARSCLALKDRPALADSLTARAIDLLADRYTPARVEEAIAAVYAHW